MNDHYIIKAESITKTYHSGRTIIKAIDNVSINIAKGDFLMITGRNGSGKSTLLHQLALLDSPDSGAIHIEEKNTTKLHEKGRMEFRLLRLGYIFQEYALIAELTAIENVMLPAMMLESIKKAKRKAFELMEKLGLEEKVNRLPSELSGGEQQKVAIARALINRPKIIFADEPTANLDTIASKDVLDIFKYLNQKESITIVMITHEPEELAYAKSKVQLSDGRIVS